MNGKIKEMKPCEGERKTWTDVKEGERKKRMNDIETTKEEETNVIEKEFQKV